MLEIGGRASRACSTASIRSEADRVHGRADGNTAVIWKVHHAMIDGVSGVDLTMAPRSLPVPPRPRRRPRPGSPGHPDSLALLQDAVKDRLTEVTQAITDDAFRLLRPTELEARLRQLAGAVGTSAPNLLRPAPRVPFNGPISTERRFGWAEFPFGEFRRVKSVLGDLERMTADGAAKSPCSLEFF